jgi:alpha-tubulin suppressor-like RCC1 family protein
MDSRAMRTVTALTSSWEGSGALLSTGAYDNWGYNAAGQLGDGSTANSSVPVQVKLPGPARQVSQGGSGPANGQTVVILTTGSVWTWGNNQHGQLGDGSRANSDVPVRVNVPAGTTYVAANSGGCHLAANCAAPLASVLAPATRGSWVGYRGMIQG